jgi:ribosomal protein L16 Arg81 hydroxylase
MPAAPTLFEFADVVAPVTVEEFLAEYYEQRCLMVHRNEPSYYSKLLPFESFDDLLELRPASSERVYAVSAHREISAEDYTLPDGRPDAARLYQLFAEGGTIIFPQMQDSLPSLSFLCRGAEQFFNCPFQTNVYYTPSNAQGFKTHHDTHDVFVLQVAGSKQWRVYDTAIRLPLPGQIFDAGEHPIGAPVQEFKLNAGDLFYCPRGVPHDAVSTDEPSLHITFGALSYSWAEVMIEAMADLCLKDVEFRKSLPPGFASATADAQALDSTFRSLVEKFQQAAHLTPAIDIVREKFVLGRRPLLPGQRLQIFNLPRLTLDSWVGRRPGLIYELRRGDHELNLLCASTSIKFPNHVADAVAFALETERFRVRDLPCQLDEQGRLTLARRLIREGLIMAVD